MAEAVKNMFDMSPENNKKLSLAVGAFLVIYSAFIATKLPYHIAKLFSNPIVLFLIIVTIFFVSLKNPALGVLLGVALIMSIHSLFSHQSAAVATVDKMFNAPMTQNTYQLEDISDVQDVNFPDQLLTELGSESKDDPSKDCKDQYRNKFYPQYVNYDTESYESRYNGQEVGAYDPDAGKYQKK